MILSKQFQNLNETEKKLVSDIDRCANWMSSIMSELSKITYLMFTSCWHIYQYQRHPYLKVNQENQNVIRIIFQHIIFGEMFLPIFYHYSKYLFLKDRLHCKLQTEYLRTVKNVWIL